MGSGVRSPRRTPKLLPSLRSKTLVVTHAAITGVVIMTSAATVRKGSSSPRWAAGPLARRSQIGKTTDHAKLKDNSTKQSTDSQGRRVSTA